MTNCGICISKNEMIVNIFDSSSYDDDGCDYVCVLWKKLKSGEQWRI